MVWKFNKGEVNMSNKKFDHELFGELTVITVNGEPMFFGNECTKILGYKNSSDAISKHVDSDEKGVAKRDTLGGAQEQVVINESGLYSLILRSKLPAAKTFKKWITSDVLPTLRKTGGFVSDVDQIIETFYKNEQPHIKEVIRAGLNFQKNNQHKINFADDVSEVVNLKPMNEVAKAFGIGRNIMFAELRKMGILDNNNAPYQRYIGSGYFKVKQVTKNKQLYNTTMITGKGEIYLHKKLKELGVLL
ncbi:antirepressor [Shewanella sp. phage 1/40]|uniref:anti-repressor Ant n=1 Tax=Shewanella sp. phage 1/40 TaxID=1458860 RepID=UPI0004F63086|nr:anti-repressor Ant [Shewanella sp. phage 1/40]AHK11542.1 antirepressor [Shewanella sp. phage 1/40]